jgi:hypothetical protein
MNLKMMLKRVLVVLILIGILGVLVVINFIIFNDTVNHLSDQHDKCVEECARENFNSSSGPRCFCSSGVLS